MLLSKEAFSTIIYGIMYWSISVAIRCRPCRRLCFTFFLFSLFSVAFSVLVFVEVMVVKIELVFVVDDLMKISLIVRKYVESEKINLVMCSVYGDFLLEVCAI